MPPIGGKIDIGASVRAAYSTVLENLRLAVDLAWLPFALLVVAEIVALVLGGGGRFGMMLAVLVRGLGFAVFGMIFIVRWHRFVLLGETIGGDLFPPGWGPFFIVAVKIGLGVLLGVVILMLVAALPPHFITGLIAVIGSLALAIGSARLSLAFPAAAIERPITLRAALGPCRRQLLAAVRLSFTVLPAVRRGSFCSDRDRRRSRLDRLAGVPDHQPGGGVCRHGGRRKPVVRSLPPTDRRTRPSRTSPGQRVNGPRVISGRCVGHSAPSICAPSFTPESTAAGQAALSLTAKSLSSPLWGRGAAPAPGLTVPGAGSGNSSSS
jgi:hypothetical protein